MEGCVLTPSTVQHFKKQIDKYLDGEFNQGDINRLESVYLSHLLEKDGVSLIELTRAVHLDKANTTRIINDLESKGYVIRKANESDSRKYKIFITEKAQKFKEKIQRCIKELNEKAFKGVTKTEKKTFSKVVHKIFENLNLL